MYRLDIYRDITIKLYNYEKNEFYYEILRIKIFTFVLTSTVGTIAFLLNVYIIKFRSFPFNVVHQMRSKVMRNAYFNFFICLVTSRSNFMRANTTFPAVYIHCINPKSYVFNETLILTLQTQNQMSSAICWRYKSSPYSPRWQDKG